MDGFTEKKWFVYLGDHHEGPLSLAEIQQRMAQAQVTPSNYVWRDGMTDWAVMTDVREFESLLSAANGGGHPSPTQNTDGAFTVQIEPESLSEALSPQEPALDAAPVEDQSGFEISTDEKSALLEEVTRTALAPSADSQGATLVSEDGPTDKIVLPQKREGAGVLRRIVRMLLLGTLVGAGSYAWMEGYLDPAFNHPVVKNIVRTVSGVVHPPLVMLSEKFPVLANIIPPIPSLDDVSPEEYEALKLAARGGEQFAQAKADVALSRDDLTAVSFYVASNLPDGARFEIVIEGVPDTLLNYVSFHAKTTVEIRNKLGKSQPIRQSEGKLLTRGEYMVYLYEADQQPTAVQEQLAKLGSSSILLPDSLPKGKKLVAKKVYFLGGPRDETYAMRLREFHEKVRIKSTAELAELNQFAATLWTQYQSSLDEFRKLGRGSRTRSKLAAWNRFHSRWMQLDSQLATAYQRWTPEAIQNGFFYGSLYALTQQVGQSVARLHGMQHAYFTGAAQANSFHVELGELTSSTDALFQSLKLKLDRASQLQAESRGIPRKEDL